MIDPCMKRRQYLYVGWTQVHPKKKRYSWTGKVSQVFQNGSDLVSINGQRLAHIRSSKTYTVERTGHYADANEILHDKLKWWIDSDLTGGMGVYGIDTRRKMSTGKADSLDEAVAAAQNALEYFGYDKMPDSFVNLI